MTCVVLPDELAVRLIKMCLTMFKTFKSFLSEPLLLWPVCRRIIVNSLARLIKSKRQTKPF